MAGSSIGEVYKDLSIERRGRSTDLFVVMHALNSSAENMAGLRAEVEARYPDADLLVPSFHASVLDNTDVYLLASQLEDRLDELDREREAAGEAYRRVVLIGHSIGSLIVRKCYVYGQGRTEDHPSLVGRTAPRPWAQRVERILLLAGINRGWALLPRPRHMSRWRQTGLALGLAAGRVANRGGLVRSVRRGTPFVADLRVQWIRLADELGARMAPVVQLLGDVDDVVGLEDNKDTLAAKNFVFIPVPGTDHKTIREFGGSHYGEVRRKRFLEALTADPELLAERYGRYRDHLQYEPTPAARPVIFLMHGIRDFGHWRTKLENAIRLLDPNAVVETSGYGWFPMARFLISRDRQRNVRWFMDRYTERLAQCPKGEFCFFGHSNGTYLLASALRRYATIRFDRVAFAGSVVPRAFPWRDYIRTTGDGRVALLRNDMGTRDLVVAIFPRFFELLHELFSRSPEPSDIGTGGFNGFADDVADSRQVYLPGGHRAGTNDANHASIARFLVSGEMSYDVKTLENPAAWVAWASRLCWMVWIALIALVVLGGWGFVVLVGGVLGLGHLPAAILYAVVVLLALYTV